jgi:uncharacterized protein YdbL (DUF1318 family)
MQRASRVVWIAVVGVAVSAGCGGSHAPGASGPASVAAPSPSTAPIDPAVAFAQFERAAKPFDCSAPYVAMSGAFEASNYAAVLDNGRKERTVMETWDAELGKIAFPPEAQPVVDKIRKLNAAELTALTELASTDVVDTERIVTLQYQVEIANSSVTLASDDLREALGHPVPQTAIAADHIDLAFLTYYQATDPLSAKFQAAVAANDLDAARAVNAVEEEAAQAYIDQLNTITWPAGFNDQINALRDNLNAIIDFDRHQVDVATAAQIAAPPEQGSPFRLADDAKSALWDALVTAYHQSDGATTCAEPLHPR